MKNESGLIRAQYEERLAKKLIEIGRLKSGIEEESRINEVKKGDLNQLEKLNDMLEKENEVNYKKI